jgi:hypothetical protein
MNCAIRTICGVGAFLREVAEGQPIIPAASGLWDAIYWEPINDHCCYELQKRFANIDVQIQR